MHRSLFLALPLLVFCGCNRSPEALVSRQIAILNEAGETLGTITDDASAASAAPTLAKLQRELNGLVPQVKALKLKDSERKELEDEHREEMEAGRARFDAELARVRALRLKVGGFSELDEAAAE